MTTRRMMVLGSGPMDWKGSYKSILTGNWGPLMDPDCDIHACACIRHI